jgi:hypothetical protein
VLWLNLWQILPKYFTFLFRFFFADSSMWSMTLLMRLYCRARVSGLPLPQQQQCKDAQPAKEGCEMTTPRGILMHTLTISTRCWLSWTSTSPWSWILQSSLHRGQPLSLTVRVTKRKAKWSQRQSA